jgi:hypothetical protein
VAEGFRAVELSARILPTRAAALLLALALLPAICAPHAAQDSAPASQPDAAARAAPVFAFAWPSGTAGRVIEAWSKDGLDLSMSAALQLQPDVGGACRLERSDPRIESYRGYAPSNRFVSKLVLQLEASSPAQPSMRIGADGVLQSLANYDEIVVDTIAKQAAAGMSDAEQQAAVELLLSPASRARAERQVREQWACWYEHWAGIPLAEPWSEERELSVDLPKGRRGRTGSVKRSYHGLEPHGGSPTHHFARFELRQGPWFLQMALPGLGSLLPGLEVSKVRGVTLTDQTEAWIDVATSRPVEVTRRSTWRIALEGAEPRKTEQITRWTFEWTGPAAGAQAAAEPASKPDAGTGAK